MSWISDHYAVLLWVVYLVVNEVVAANPNVVSSSIAQLLWGALKSAVGNHPLPPPKV